MTEEETTQAAATETSESNETSQQTKPTETVDFWKQKAREQEKRAKDNADAAKRLADLEESQKSEQQKLTERLEAAEKRATDAETNRLRLEVASEKGLTSAQAKRLMGSTREELESDADDLLSTFKTTADAKQEQAAASLDLGTRNANAATGTDPASDFAKFLGRQLGHTT